MMFYFNLLLLLSSANALSFFNPSEASALSQKAVMRNSLGMSRTRREPIRMPSQTPMVPWKVNNTARDCKTNSEMPARLATLFHSRTRLLHLVLF